MSPWIADHRSEPDQVRVLVTGAGGFVGSHLVDVLLGKGHQVVAIAGRRTTGRLSLDPDETPGLTVLLQDLGEEGPLPDGIEAVVHAAAVSPGPDVSTTASDFVRNNAEATRRLSSWARRAGVRKFVYFSSVSAFGRVAGPVLEESSPRVEPDAYGVSKWLGEVMLEEQADAMPSISLRLPSVIGPGAARNWLATMASAAREGREIAYFHGDADYNNTVHVEDVCRFVVDLLHRDLRGHDMVLLAAAGAMKVGDMVGAIAAGLGGRSPLRELPAPRPGFTISIARARERYGYRPMTMHDTVARFVADSCARPGLPAGHWRQWRHC
jgi:UDP-glucose 4-epimerase